jgi:hypothetical protein
LERAKVRGDVLVVIIVVRSDGAVVDAHRGHFDCSSVCDTAGADVGNLLTNVIDVGALAANVAYGWCSTVSLKVIVFVHVTAPATDMLTMAVTLVFVDVDDVAV